MTKAEREKIQELIEDDCGYVDIYEPRRAHIESELDKMVEQEQIVRVDTVSGGITPHGDQIRSLLNLKEIYESSVQAYEMEIEKNKSSLMRAKGLLDGFSRAVEAMQIDLSMK